MSLRWSCFHFLEIITRMDKFIKGWIQAQPFEASDFCRCKAKPRQKVTSSKFKRHNQSGLWNPNTLIQWQSLRSPWSFLLCCSESETSWGFFLSLVFPLRHFPMFYVIKYSSSIKIFCFDCLSMMGEMFRHCKIDF